MSRQVSHKTAGFALILALLASPAWAGERPIIFQHSDSQGNSFTMFEGSCAQGPIELVVYGHVYTVKAGEHWPAGCEFTKKRRH